MTNQQRYNDCCLSESEDSVNCIIISKVAFVASRAPGTVPHTLNGLNPRTLHWYVCMSAGEVGSKKYHAAASRKLPVMQPQWVKLFWEKEQHTLAHASSDAYNHLRLPAFKGLSITVSQVRHSFDFRARRDVTWVSQLPGSVFIELSLFGCN